MDEGKEIEQSSDPDVNSFIIMLSKPSPGHTDSEGKLKPENVDMEIRNKVSSLGNQLYLWRRKNKPESTINEAANLSLKKMKETFQQTGRIDFLKQQLDEMAEKEDSELSRYKNVIQNVFGKDIDAK